MHPASWVPRNRNLLPSGLYFFRRLKNSAISSLYAKALSFLVFVLSIIGLCYSALRTISFVKWIIPVTVHVMEKLGVTENDLYEASIINMNTTLFYLVMVSLYTIEQVEAKEV